MNRVRTRALEPRSICRVVVRSIAVLRGGGVGFGARGASTTCSVSNPPSPGPRPPMTAIDTWRRRREIRPNVNINSNFIVRLAAAVCAARQRSDAWLARISKQYYQQRVSSLDKQPRCVQRNVGRAYRPIIQLPSLCSTCSHSREYLLVNM